MSGVQYEVLKMDHYERCRELIYDQFITRETFCKRLNIQKSYCMHGFDELLKQAVEEEKSFVAILDEKVIGLRCNFERSLDQEQKKPTNSGQETKNDMDKIWQLMADLKSSALEKLRDFSCRIYMDFELVVVHENYCRMGVAQMMVEMSLNLARNLNFDGVLTVATTPKSIKMFEKLNFVTLISADSEYLMKQIPEMKNDNDDCESLIVRVMYKNLKEFSS